MRSMASGQILLSHEDPAVRIDAPAGLRARGASARHLNGFPAGEDGHVFFRGLIKLGVRRGFALEPDQDFLAATVGEKIVAARYPLARSYNHSRIHHD